MLLETVQVLAGKNLSQKTKNSIYKNGFFFASGIFSGIALDNLWHKLSIPGTDKAVIQSGPQGGLSLSDTKQDQAHQSILIAGILLTSIITGKYTEEVLPMCAGAFLGINWANLAEKGGQNINVLPF